MAQSSEEFWDDFWDVTLAVTTFGTGNLIKETIKAINGDPHAFEDPHIKKLRRKWEKEQAEENAAWRKQYDDKYNEYQNLYNKIKSKYGEEYVEDQFARSTSSWKSEGDNLFKEDQNNVDLFNADLNKLNEQIKALQDLDAANDKTQDTSEINAEKLAGNTEAQTAMSNAQSARNAGINKSRAGALSSTDNFGSTYRDSVEGLKNQNTLTQADYLEKMGYSKALDMAADNLEKGAGYNTTAAVFQGMSDKTEKENIDDEDDKLDPSNGFDAITQLQDELECYDDEDVLEQLAQLETIKYQYKNPEKDGEDDDIHLSGFTAQSMQKLPLFKGVVKEIDGDLRVNVAQLEKILTEKILPVIKNIVE